MGNKLKAAGCAGRRRGGTARTARTASTTTAKTTAGCGSAGCRSSRSGVDKIFGTQIIVNNIEGKTYLLEVDANGVLERLPVEVRQLESPREEIVNFWIYNVSDQLTGSHDGEWGSLSDCAS
jgi:hypothetical protein